MTKNSTVLNENEIEGLRIKLKSETLTFMQAIKANKEFDEVKVLYHKCKATRKQYESLIVDNEDYLNDEMNTFDRFAKK